MMKFNPNDRSHFSDVDYLLKVKLIKLIKLINRICLRKSIKQLRQSLYQRQFYSKFHLL